MSHRRITSLRGRDQMLHAYIVLPDALANDPEAITWNGSVYVMAQMMNGIRVYREVFTYHATSIPKGTE